MPTPVAPPVITEDCLDRDTLNAAFAELGNRIGVLEDAGAATTTGLLRADGTVNAVAPTTQTVDGTSPSHLVRLSQVPVVGHATCVSGGTANITVPVTATACVVSVRDGAHIAHVSAFAPPNATVTLTALPGALAGSYTIDYVAK